MPAFAALARFVRIEHSDCGWTCLLKFKRSLGYMMKEFISFPYSFRPAFPKSAPPPLFRIIQKENQNPIQVIPGTRLSFFPSSWPTRQNFFPPVSIFVG